MVYWIKKIAGSIAFIAFVAVFFLGLQNGNPLDTDMGTFLFATLKAFGAAALFWIIGFVIADIALKGVVEDIPREKIDILEGGVVHHVLQAKKKTGANIVEEIGAPIEIKDTARSNVEATRPKTD